MRDNYLVSGDSPPQGIWFLRRTFYALNYWEWTGINPLGFLTTKVKYDKIPYEIKQGSSSDNGRGLGRLPVLPVKAERGHSPDPSPDTGHAGVGSLERRSCGTCRRHVFFIYPSGSAKEVWEKFSVSPQVDSERIGRGASFYSE